MAISKSFFGIRRGSTKDHTFSAYRGKQVTKSRVVKVANPQSDVQMRQRLHLVQVANAATKLKGLINHSFEGVAYGQASISKFRALNLQKNLLNVYSYVPKDFGDCGVAEFIVAKGSLPEIATKFDLGAEKTAAPTMGLKLTVTEANAKESVTKWISANNLQEGDQLTFLAGFQTGTSMEIQGVEAFSHAFAISRLELKFDENGELILNKDGINEGWSINEDKEGETVKAYGLQNSYFGFAISTNSGGDADTKLGFSGAGFSEEEGYVYDMAAVIHSRLENGVWRRSLSRFACRIVSDYRVTFEEALPTYIKSTASQKYLNLGPQKTGILGNQ